MSVLLQIVFWASLSALAHTYVVYPLLMRWLAAGKAPNAQVFGQSDTDLPIVSVIMSLYNEEKVALQKLQSLAQLDYPAEKLQFFIGSDCSEDQTNAICSAFGAAAPGQFSGRFHFRSFAERRGKPAVVNDLAALAFEKNAPAPGHVILLTDASVMLRPDTLFELVKHFKNEKIGVVDAHMLATGLQETGISRSENRYMSGETRLKYCESLAWGMMIGPFGGCYALRSDLFAPVPTHFLVDDFHIVFRALERGFSAINDLKAICYEGATHRVGDEYRRKKRIAAGSFQNLSAFRRWVLPPTTRLGFAFFSHKVLRWLGGFFIGFGFLAAAILALDSVFFRWVAGAFLGALVGIPILNWLLERLQINVLPLKNLAYFLAMNAALVEGFFKFRRGIRSGTWQRTTRY